LCTDKSGQEKRETKNGEKAKKKKIQRIRDRLHLKVNPNTYDYIKDNGLNVSGFMDNALNGIRNKTNKESAFILQNNEKLWAR